MVLWHLLGFAHFLLGMRVWHQLLPLQQRFLWVEEVVVVVVASVVVVDVEAAVVVVVEV